jgi:Fur family ferric uptake transcriptional regulator/Fur family peroxide stress response transcriptional regulator
MLKELRTHIETRVREAGLKLTPQRFAVLEFLIRTPEHPTADQIGAELNLHFPRASRATIYNTLNALRDAGLIQEVYVDGYVARYDTNLDEHHHFVCRVCDKLEDVPLSAITALPESELGAGYAVENYEIVLRGVCPSCNKASLKTKRQKTKDKNK